MKRILLTVVICITTIAFVTTGFAEIKHIQHDLNKLAKKAEERLKGLDKKIAKMEEEQRAQDRLDELNDLYTRAEVLYNQGKYDEAKSLYLQIERVAKNVDFDAETRQRKKEFKRLRKEKMKEEKAKIKAEKARQKELAKERKAKELAKKKAAIERKKAAKKKELNRKKRTRKTKKKRKGALIKFK